MKTLTFNQAMNGIGIAIFLVLAVIVTYNISVYGICSSASFEF